MLCNCDAVLLYGSKVRYLTYRQPTGLDSERSCLLASHCDLRKPLFPSLIYLKITVRKWRHIHLALASSPNLRCLDLDLGFSVQPENNEDKAHQFLVQVLHSTNRLHEFHIRGTLPRQFHRLTPFMQNLHTLSLRTAASLTVDALLLIAHLRSLIELDLHAGHLSPEELSSNLGGNCFPSLLKLRLRAWSTTIKVILSALRDGMLKWLWIEAQDPSHTDVAWDDFSRLITTKASDSLQFLGLEHHVEFMQDDTHAHPPVSNGLAPPPPTLVVPSAITSVPAIPPTYLTLKSFNKLHVLEHLQFEMTIPPALVEQDVWSLSQGCPDLRVLDLGGTSSFENNTMSALTQSTLQTFLQFQKLETLVLPSIYTMDPEAPIPTKALDRQHPLRSLVLGKVLDWDGPALARHLSGLFPGLVRIDGAPTQDDIWLSVRAEILRLQMQRCLSLSAIPS